MSLGIVVPAYKEGEHIVTLIREILKFVPNSTLVVVDDSPDVVSKKAVEALGLPNVSIIHRSAKGGRGSAVLDGIDFLLKSGCDPILEMDADFSHPPKQIPELIKVLQDQKLDLLIASRYLPESRIENWPVSRRVFSKCANILAHSMLRVPVCDYTNGYRVYSKKAAQLITETCNRTGRGFISLSEILVNVFYRGLKVAEVPTVFTNRVRGESSLSYAEIKNALTGLFQIYNHKRKLVDSQHRVATGVN